MSLAEGPKGNIVSRRWMITRALPTVGLGVVLSLMPDNSVPANMTEWDKTLKLFGEAKRLLRSSNLSDTQFLLRKEVLGNDLRLISMEDLVNYGEEGIDRIAHDNGTSPAGLFEATSDWYHLIAQTQEVGESGLYCEFRVREDGDGLNRVASVKIHDGKPETGRSISFKWEPSFPRDVVLAQTAFKAPDGQWEIEVQTQGNSIPGKMIIEGDLMTDEDTKGKSEQLIDLAGMWVNFSIEDQNGTKNRIESVSKFASQVAPLVSQLFTEPVNK